VPKASQSAPAIRGSAPADTVGRLQAINNQSEEKRNGRAKK